MTEPAPGSGTGVPADAGTIALTLQGNVATSNVISPTVSINGYAVQTSYGLNEIPMPPGRHHVEIHSQWMRKFGQAAIDVDVQTGESVAVFYATPYHQFTTGSMGFEKQRRNGRGFLYLMAAIAAFFIALIVLLALI